MLNDTSFSTVITTLPAEVDTHLIKVVFVGSAAVGKTCLIRRLFTDKFAADARPTIGCDFQFKRYKFDNRSVGVTVWDTAGAEKFRAITSNYYRGAQGVVFVYDVTKRQTLQDLRDQWLPDVERSDIFPETVKMVVGNKIDRMDEREVSPAEGAQFAREHNCLYQETSALTDEGVYDALIWGLIVQIMDTPTLLRSYNPERLMIARPAAAQNEGGRQGRGCCG